MKTMTTDGHRKGSNVSHRKLSDEKFERDIVEVKAHLSVLIELLQKGEEDQVCR
jgi:hypothetical protein